jgi:hypothetical protein
MTHEQQVLLLVAVGLLSLGSFILGFTLAKLPMRGRRKGRHAKGRGRHAK